MTEKPVRRDPEEGRIYVDGPGDVPEFATDEEEAEFWRTHTFSPESWAGAPRGPRRGGLRERLMKQRRKADQQAAG